MRESIACYTSNGERVSRAYRDTVPAGMTVGITIDRRAGVSVADDNVQAAHLGAKAAGGALFFIQDERIHMFPPF